MKKKKKIPIDPLYSGRPDTGLIEILGDPV